MMSWSARSRERELKYEYLIRYQLKIVSEKYVKVGPGCAAGGGHVGHDVPVFTSDI